MNICNSPDEEISKFCKFNLMRSNLLDFFDNTSIKIILRVSKILLKPINLVLSTSILNVDINIIRGYWLKNSFEHIEIHLIVKGIVCLMKGCVIKLRFIFDNQYTEMQVLIVKEIVHHILVIGKFRRRYRIPFQLTGGSKAMLNLYLP